MNPTEIRLLKDVCPYIYDAYFITQSISTKQLKIISQANILQYESLLESYHSVMILSKEKNALFEPWLKPQDLVRMIALSESNIYAYTNCIELLKGLLYLQNKKLFNKAPVFMQLAKILTKYKLDRDFLENYLLKAPLAEHDPCKISSPTMESLVHLQAQLMHLDPKYKSHKNITALITFILEQKCAIGYENILCPVYIRGETETYECKKLMQWLQKNNSSPISRKPITDKDIILGYAQKNIDAFIHDTLEPNYASYSTNTFFNKRLHASFNIHANNHQCFSLSATNF